MNHTPTSEQIRYSKLPTGSAKTPSVAIQQYPIYSLTLACLKQSSLTVHSSNTGRLRLSLQYSVVSNCWLCELLRLKLTLTTAFSSFFFWASNLKHSGWQQPQTAFFHPAVFRGRPQYSWRLPIAIWRIFLEVCKPPTQSPKWWRLPTLAPQVRQIFSKVKEPLPVNIRFCCNGQK